MKLRIKRNDPPLVTSIKIGDQQLLQEVTDEDDVGAFWRLHLRGFTIDELATQMKAEWGIPSAQLTTKVSPSIDDDTKLRLPEKTSILA